MGFSDQDWDTSCQLFPRHEEVQGYLENYASDVRHLIQFRTQVLDVRLSRDDRWLVQTQRITQDYNAEVREEIFDAVVVANGHFNIPYIPNVPGIQDWNRLHPGSITHSKFYRNAKAFAGKKVIVVGNSASGVDIGRQIEAMCKPPLISSARSVSTTFLPDDPSKSKVDKPAITEFDARSRNVHFADGSIEEDVDAIVYCTGYFYSFPFLSSLDPPLITTGEKVENLYQHMFYQPRPTLAFPVLNQKVIPFPLAEAQSAVIARVLSGRLTLPDEAVMRTWEKDWAKQNGDGRKFHVLQYPKDCDYIDFCHDWAMSADREGEKTTNKDGLAVKVGKMPPYWGEKEYWYREKFPAIKKAFQDLGEERHQKKSLRELGYDFDDWKAEQRRQQESEQVEPDSTARP